MTFIYLFIYSYLTENVFTGPCGQGVRFVCVRSWAGPRLNQLHLSTCTRVMELTFSTSDFHNFRLSDYVPFIHPINPVKLPGWEQRWEWFHNQLCRGRDVVVVSSLPAWSQCSTQCLGCDCVLSPIVLVQGPWIVGFFNARWMQ